MRFGRDNKTVHEQKTSQSRVYIDHAHRSQTPRYPHPRVRIPSTRSAPCLRPRDRTRALASSRSDACTLPPSYPTAHRAHSPRTPRSAPRIFRADVADDVSRTPPTMRRSHAARDRPRRSRTRRRRSRCGDANACDEICITPCDWAYLWKVSSDRAAKCRASRPHRQPRAFVSFGGGRGAMVSRGNHVVCAYGIELVMGKSTRNFYRDTRSRAPGENLCV